MQQPVTLQQALREAQSVLAALPSARLDAELLLCEVIRCDRSHLYAAAGSELQESSMGRYRKLVEQRKNGMPVAYLTGEREFWSLSLHVNEHTLVPRPETECLVERLLELVPAAGSFRIADLGTGSGAIAIAIASERRACHITATDISPAALVIAGKNIRQYDLENIRLREGNWLQVLDGKYDVIVSNPPYICSTDSHLLSAELLHEPRIALDGGVDGMSALRDIIGAAPAFLQPGGWLLLEHGYDQAVAVHQILRQNGFIDIRTDRDYAGIERLTSARHE